MKKPIIALMYDFDKTLSPKNMQDYGFMEGLDVEPEAFWSECARLTKRENMDSILAYMFLMLEKAQGKMMLRREDFQALGKSVRLFPGVRTWFERINAYCDSVGLFCEHYIISSGLKEIIEGTPIAGEFKRIYAAEYLYGKNGLARWPAMAVNYTSKTQFLFRVNKGVLNVTEQRKLNRFMPDEERRVPFSHMIYIGDGDTDVPCMQLVRSNGGCSVAVFRDDRREADKLVSSGRASFALPADYRAGRSLENVVRMVADKVAAEDRLRSN